MTGAVTRQMASVLSRTPKPHEALCVAVRYATSVTSTSTVGATEASSDAPPKPFSEIPGRRGLPIIGSLLDYFKYHGRFHDLHADRAKEYGPVIREKIVSTDLVYLSDPRVYETLFRQPVKYPRRIQMIPWLAWREENKHAKGILIEDGPKWRSMRTVLDKLMLKPRRIASFVGDFNDVITDFITRIRHVRSEHGGGERVPAMDMELFHWSLETIGTVLYEIRFGGLGENKSQEQADIINAVRNMFISTNHISHYPYWFARWFLPKWFKVHANAWATVFDAGKKIIDARLEEIQAQIERGEEVSTFLGSLIASQEMSRPQIYANIVELMLAAVDTTSNTMQWVLYELSRNPDIQDTLHKEIMSATGGNIPSYQDIQKMPYLRGIIKEALRLYPVTGVVTNQLTEDTVIGGYLIPENTAVLCLVGYTGRDPKYFKDPEVFRPERWYRENKKEIDPFAWLPFSFGPRMCIGRRVAELELQLLLTRICQEFILSPVSDEPLHRATLGLTVPERPVDVKYIDRQK